MNVFDKIRRHVNPELEVQGMWETVGKQHREDGPAEKPPG